jgi:hypothetical protein
VWENCTPQNANFSFPPQPFPGGEEVKVRPCLVGSRELKVGKLSLETQIQRFSKLGTRGTVTILGQYEYQPQGLLLGWNGWTYAVYGQAPGTSYTLEKHFILVI